MEKVEPRPLLQTLAIDVLRLRSRVTNLFVKRMGLGTRGIAANGNKIKPAPAPPFFKNFDQAPSDSARAPSLGDHQSTNFGDASSDEQLVFGALDPADHRPFTFRDKDNALFVFAGSFEPFFHRCAIDRVPEHAAQLRHRRRVCCSRFAHHHLGHKFGTVFLQSDVRGKFGLRRRALLH
jgi:hypothetical protein